MVLGSSIRIAVHSLDTSRRRITIFNNFLKIDPYSARNIFRPDFEYFFEKF